MNIVYYLGAVSLSGGSLVLAQHVKILRNMGHNAYFVCLRQDDDYDFGIPLMRVESPEQVEKFHPDLTVACHARDISALRPYVRKLIFLVQEPHFDTLDMYYREKYALPKYSGLFGRLLLGARKRRDVRHLRRAYAAADIFWCVSPQLQNYLKGLDITEIHIVRNTVAPCFNPPATRTLPVTILLIGTHSIQFKNILAGLEALRRLKNISQVPIRIIHVSTGEPLPPESASIPDEQYTRLPHDRMAELCQRCHILFSPSFDEGFGLPALEGMASGMLCVLSDIKAYHSFTSVGSDPYALYFNPYDTTDMTVRLSEAVSAYLDGNSDALIRSALQISAYYREEGLIQDLNNGIASAIRQ